MTLVYSLAAIDLDGTLLGSNHAVSPGNTRAVREAARQGMTIVLASGRRWGTIEAFARELDLPAFSPLIAYNGALIRTRAGETWFHQPVPAETARAIVRYCQQHGFHLNFYWNDELYVRDDTLWNRMYERRTGTAAHVVGDLTQFDDRQPTKLLLIDTRETIDRLLLHFRAEFGDSLYIVKTEDEYLEFMDPRVNKGVALAEVAHRLGLASDDCVAFGDSYNDIPMLQWAGLGIAMDNARPELKAVAYQIAPSADADGVAAMLTTLFKEPPRPNSGEPELD